MSTVSSASASTVSKLVVNGLVSGITTPAVINALLEAYQKPVTDLQSQQTSLNKEASDYRTLATALQAVETAAQALSTKSAWDLATATTSNSSVATAVATAGTERGSLSFSVTQLAQANVLASSGAAASENEVVTSASSMLLATGAVGIGVSQLAVSTAGTLDGTGAFSITVTQASAGASVTGSARTGTVHVTATATLALTVVVAGNAKRYTLTIATGTYATASALAAAVTSAAGAAGAPISAAAGATGGLVLTTTSQGTTASITVSGGTALTAIGLTTGESGSGTDAFVTVGGTKNTVTALTAGSVLTLDGPDSSSIAVTVASTAGPSGALLSAGTASVADVSTGNRSLADVVSAINSSGLSATASAVQLESGDYILQVSADGTGTAGAVSVDSAALTGSALGQLREITAAQDATVSVGGTVGYTLRSSTDTFSNLLPGTSVTVAATGQATVTVTPDATGEASRVASLVTAANSALADIQTYAGYTTTKKVGGPLMGNAVIDGIKNEIMSVFAGGSGTSSLGDVKNAGVSLSKTATLAFTRAVFTAAFATNPTAVEDLFVQGGKYAASATGVASDVAFSFAGTTTAAGTYRVAISQSATQATDTGRTLATGRVSTPESLTVTAGTASATYETTTGESLANVASGLNAAFAGAKLGLSAEVTGERLEIVSSAYGSAASFSVTSTTVGTGSATGTTGLGTATAATFTGTNVAGTIGGLEATGKGQVLSLPAGVQGGGLGVLVTATGISAATPPVTLGTLAYRPGVAQQLSTAMSAATNVATGSITTAIKSLTNQATGLNSQISMYERLEAEQRTTLEKEFTNMETTLSKLKNESSQLTSELAKLKNTSLT